MLRKALGELKLWGLTREFSFADAPAGATSATTAAVSKQAGAKAGTGSSGGAGGKGAQQKGVVLIKEWREVLSEVGDHQSLVASLKQSSFHYLFKVGGTEH